MSKIQLIILDVDGTLTNSAVYYGDNNIEIKAFSTRDGLILKKLPSLGISVILLTGRNSEAVQRRASDLGTEVIQGVDNKLAVLKALLIKKNIEPEQCAYIGDDINDYTAMKICRLKACPADAVAEIKKLCDYVSPYNGGYGAVRDICENILKLDGKYKEFLSLYGI